MCLKCLLADPLTDFEKVQHFSSFYNESSQTTNVRNSMTQNCCLCDQSGGYLTYTSQGAFVHKQCGFSLPNSQYNLFNSNYSTDHSTPTQHLEQQNRPCFEQESVDTFVPTSSALRTAVEFVLPDELFLASSTSCCICHGRKGCMVSCGYTDCTRSYHVSCLRHSHCVYFPSPDGLFVRCLDHIPSDYQYDPYSNAIVPKQYLCIPTVLKEHTGELEKAKENWRRVQSRMEIACRDSIQQLKNKITEVVNYHNRKLHFVTFSGHHLHVEKSMLSNWCTQQNVVHFLFY